MMKEKETGLMRLLQYLHLFFAILRDFFFVILIILGIKFLAMLLGNFFPILKYLIKLAEKL